jgi:hypothetical protein
MIGVVIKFTFCKSHTAFYSANKFAGTGADKSANTFSNSQKGLKK